ncbi:hypothetical protein E2C01_047941 [Portunus trituberculatus]|uniref:Uncharacterized protein n=1 Tax=Portunus trituberculatus TaxID=210409 RepID=A0A5B7GBW8_PORTR|nr:hypothetical protein [Portunus trituberculatus]
MPHIVSYGTRDGYDAAWVTVLEMKGVVMEGRNTSNIPRRLLTAVHCGRGKEEGGQKQGGKRQEAGRRSAAQAQRTAATITATHAAFRVPKH